MRFQNWWQLALATGSVLLMSFSALAQSQADHLRCEYRSAPLGIDAAQPRLSWQMNDPRRGVAQSAYQVLVASSPDQLAADQADLWDSGKVETDQCNAVVYAGKPLTSRAACWWKVRLWDEQGNPGPWSESTRWTMGLLEKSDWQAKWITHQPKIDDAEAAEYGASLEDCSWYWFPEAAGDPMSKAPQGQRVFRRVLELPADTAIARATATVTADDLVTMLLVNGQRFEPTGVRQNHLRAPKMFDITTALKSGPNALALIAQNEKPSRAGAAGKFVILLADGRVITQQLDESWRCSDQEPDHWFSADFDDSSWPAPRRLAAMGEPPWNWLTHGNILDPCPYLRRDFDIDKTVRRAMVYVTARGFYELHINGRTVSEDQFSPGWSDFNKRIYYQTYDVTDLLQQGDNAVGAVLAPGWYAGHVGFQGAFRYGRTLSLLAQLEIEFADGSKQVIASDESWRGSQGPIRGSDMQMGELYDATRSQIGWDAPGFDDARWSAVTVEPATEAAIEAHPGVPVRRTGELTPLSSRQIAPGCWIYDLGQNFAGRLRLQGALPAGTKLVLRHAEILNPDGTLYTENLRTALATDHYVAAGGQFTWEPTFTFHGFRYAEIAGLPDDVDLTVTGIALNSDTPQVGFFECSSPLVNQLVSNILWTQRANFIEIPTDCPQRDERLGWTGDAQIFIPTANWNMDVSAFFTKWLIDLDDGQNAEGAYPNVAPTGGMTGYGVAAWGDAGVICPWVMYQFTNDTRYLEDHFDNMVRWVEYCRNNSDKLLRPAAGFGEWLSINADTPKDVLATAYFALSTHLVARSAAVLGCDEDAAKYEQLFQQIRKAFNDAYVTPDGRVKGDTQACYLMALNFDLLPDELRDKTAALLIEDVRSRDWHLSTGFIGVGFSLPALTAIGRNDVAYRLLLNETFPSWGYSIRQGATSIWERWDGWTEDKGFQTPQMNSFAHYAFGSVGNWLYSAVAGIESDGPGFARIKIHPRLANPVERPAGSGLTWAKASYRSVRGQIESAWHIADNRFELNITIPANTVATVYIPTADASTVTESGHAAVESEGVRFLRMEGSAALYEVKAGRYSFAAPWTQSAVK
ncbi:MAG: family 78 glycoside hydrolase catalytic domain [Phycisphaeraceae bacterium]|nr:family 78 glycoside hydrolase catalytic domain [Phycisphaeraceae bacterium]